jgi:uncharacterized coiled-coil protein SlyX
MRGVFGDLEERINTVVSSQSAQIQGISNAVTAKGKKVSRELKTLRSQLEELKSTVDDLREKREQEPKGQGKGKATSSPALPAGFGFGGGTRSSPVGGVAADSAGPWRRRLRVRGWAPFGSDPSNQLSMAAAEDLIATLKGAIPAEHASDFVFQRPYHNNFQILARIPGCSNVDEAFKLRQILLTIVEEQGLVVHGKRVEVALEPDETRRQLLSVFFSWANALAAALPAEAGKFVYEIPTLSLFHARSHQPVFRINKTTCEPIFTKISLGELGVTEDIVRGLHIER